MESIDREAIRAYMTQVSHARMNKTKLCRACGKLLTNVSNRRMYCGDTCMQRVYRKRKRERLAELEALVAAQLLPSALPREEGPLLDL